MKTLMALLTMVLLSVSVGACGGTSKGVSSAVRPAPDAVAITGTPTTSGSRGPKPIRVRKAYANNQIRTYGHVAGATDRQAVTTLVKRYYATAVAGDGAKACTMIYSTLEEAVPNDYGKPPGRPELKGKTCAVVLSKLFRDRREQPTTDLTTIQVTGVRVDGDRGFALLRSRTMPAGEIGVERETGEWKIDSLLGNEFR